MKELAECRPGHLSGDGKVDETTRRSELARAFYASSASAGRQRREM
ncbi:hypothetical protein FB559_3426 [Actinoallomurus bryophytorum]|uniref:Uncharacterized protein n=2 Tax=Actinoallomurus bryophytorum TaxID=1490222 RepID=A0A543CLC9_9ACTN|nr:hypothetical protein FB559_3426 [Actinoallomurus bryophytorum]